MRRSLHAAGLGCAVGLCAALSLASGVRAADSIELVAEAVGSARSGSIAELQLALAHGASVNTRNRIGDTLLAIAIKGDHSDYALKVLEVGADPQIANASGVTPLMAAAYQGDTAVMKVLIAKHVDLNAVDRVKKTAMVYAAGSGHTEAVRLLLDAGVPVNARYDAELTALMWAAGNGGLETTQLLLQRGADASLKDDRGKDALTMAREGNFAPIVTVLQASH